MRQCKWDRAWVGQCKNEAIAGAKFCEQHNLKVCASCGLTAVRDCEHTGIQFVCGTPLCETCKHGIPDPDNVGMFALGGGHVTEEEYAKQFAAKYGT